MDMEMDEQVNAEYIYKWICVLVAMVLIVMWGGVLHHC